MVKGKRTNHEELAMFYLDPHDFSWRESAQNTCDATVREKQDLPPVSILAPISAISSQSSPEPIRVDLALGLVSGGSQTRKG